MDTITELFPGAIVVDVEPQPVGVVYRPLAVNYDAAIRAALGRITNGQIASYEVQPGVGRVVIACVKPLAVVDPPIPLALCPMSPDHWRAMGWYWPALLLAVTGRGLGRWRRSVKVVLHTLDGLTEPERDFFAAGLWAAILREV